MATTKLKKYKVPVEGMIMPVFVTGYNLVHARAVLKEELARVGVSRNVVIFVTPQMLNLEEVEFANPDVR